MPEGPLARIVGEAGVPDLVEILAERLDPTDLQSLLLEVYRRRTARITPARLLARFEEDRFSAPAQTAPAVWAAFEQTVWSLLPKDYLGIELSPACPLGTNSVIATVDQNKVVSTIRNSEVVADSTNVLALECAVRRKRLLAHKETRSEPVQLASSHRVLRAQAFRSPQALSHFRLIGLAAAGRDRGSMSFETDSLCQQIGYIIELINHARPEWGVRVAITDLCDRAMLWEQRVLATLSEHLPLALLEMDPQRKTGRGYYVDVCFKVFATDPSGAEIELADGGCTTWTRRMLSNEKERLVIAGVGVERILTSVGAS